MCKKLSIAVALCAAAASFSASAAPVQCGDVITTKRVLTSDLSCTGFDPALTVQGPKGSLDMRGHTLSCEGAVFIGIDMANAQLRNGTVTACIEGVELNGQKNTVNRMTLQGNEVGLSIEGGSGHRVTGSTALDNASGGFASFSGGNFFFDNRAVSNGSTGFDTNDNSGNGQGDKYLRNVALNNGENGFVVRDNNTLVRNTASRNVEDGFAIEGESNTLTGNIARRNFDDGIDAEQGSLNNTLSGNNASGNGSADTEGNGGFDLEDDNPNCDNNAWTNNAGLNSQPCVQ